MENDTVCHFCRKGIKGRPFVPVRTNSPYHWKCYINKVKEEKSPSETVEEPVTEEPKVVEEEEVV